MTSVAPQRSLSYCLHVQANVIGATIMRELHTRFGRDNIGYLWFFVEPMLLAVGITIAHLATKTAFPGGLDVASFCVTGYVSYMLFRQNVNRAAGTLEGNKTLLYHKQVTIFDIIFARCLLELAATLTAMMLMLAGITALGLGHMPDRPLVLFAAMGLMFWFTLGLAMVICAASEWSIIVERLVHPMTYLALPISGMFFLISWAPERLRPVLMLIPFTEIIELVRVGEYEGVDMTYVNLPYIVAWCVGLTIIGLLAIKVTRRHMHF
jgi:capsular polysaccharide transport system permease protein